MVVKASRRSMMNIYLAASNVTLQDQTPSACSDRCQKRYIVVVERMRLD